MAKKKRLLDITSDSLDKESASLVYVDLVKHLQNNPCATIENYAGEYAGVLDDCFKNYPELFNKKNLTKYQKDSLRKVMAGVKDYIESSPMENVKPEFVRVLSSYLDRGLFDESDGENNDIQIILKRI